MTAANNSSFLILEQEFLAQNDLIQSNITTWSSNVEHADASLVQSIWAIGGAVTLSLMMIIFIVTYFVRTMMPRQGYAEFRARERQMVGITKLLEEIRGHPRSVKSFEPLTESEKHFLLHDFHDFF
nr:uncharacterized protein LOC123757027 [Procambarus clarkii]